jgi:hypothetical protein
VAGLGRRTFGRRLLGHGSAEVLVAGVVADQGDVLVGFDALLDVLLREAGGEVMVVEAFWPVSRSQAETLTMPLVSISKVTSIFTSPR